MEKPANGNANPNNQLDGKAWFCPTCASADVAASAIAGGDASCNNCSWKGKVEELATFHFSHGMGSDEAIMQCFIRDLRNVLSRDAATNLGSLLIKWGFVEAPTPKNREQVKQLLSRYLGGIAKAIVLGVIQTRREIEKERSAHA